MSDEILIDSHKLIYHPGRVSEWLKGEHIYPIYAEIALSGSCNHRCIFCALDYLNYKPVFMDMGLLLGTLQDMADSGVKSVMYAGEGEPLLNRNAAEIVNVTKKIGMDVALTSNGVLFTEEVTRECLEAFSWIRFSLNAGTGKTYGIVHRTKEADFDRVLGNLQYMVKYKRDHAIATTIGVQLLMIPENFEEVVELGKILKNTGVDYYTVKPYSQHPMSINCVGKNFDYGNFLDMENTLKTLENEKFKVFYRSWAMKKKSMEKGYDRCWGLPFWAYIDAGAKVWACSAYLGDEAFLYGDLKENSFKEIWDGGKRKKVMEHVACMDVDRCREICRLDAINTYLQELKNPGMHVNFI
ncbi:MAG: radical SAM protein [Ruminiclostridium sp.]|nr:radical SAM protein [Ruminiclostridium sp.]